MPNEQSNQSVTNPYWCTCNHGIAWHTEIHICKFPDCICLEFTPYVTKRRNSNE